MRKKIVFYLNGLRKELGAQEASMMFADYLRYDQHLTGTKIVCAEGDCGACSILRLFPSGQLDQYLPINSCITLTAQLDGSNLITVEALKDKERLHEAQRAMVTCHGSQCGFCTPGFVISLTGLIEDKKAKKETHIDAQEAKNCMTGNLCRCTGYQPIIDAALSININQEKSLKNRYFSDNQKEDLLKVVGESVSIEGDDFHFFAPKTISEALIFLKDHPEAKIIASGTDLGVIHNKRKSKLNKLLSLHLIEELYLTQLNDQKVTVGSRVSITEFRHKIKDVLPEFSNYLDVFASPQIKNIATVVGNVANASPIGDTPPALLALNTKVLIATINGNKEVLLKDFYLSYKTINIKPGEIIVGLSFDRPGKLTDFRLFKNANRKDLDISAVNMAIRVDWKDENKISINDVIIAAGGVAATPIRLNQTEDYFKSHPQDVDGTVAKLHQEIKPLSDLRASSSYRHILAENFMRRFVSECGGNP